MTTETPQFNQAPELRQNEYAEPPNIHRNENDDPVMENNDNMDVDRNEIDVIEPNESVQPQFDTQQQLYYHFFEDNQNHTDVEIVQYSTDIANVERKTFLSELSYTSESNFDYYDFSDEIGKNF